MISKKSGVESLSYSILSDPTKLTYNDKPVLSELEQKSSFDTALVKLSSPHLLLQAVPLWAHTMSNILFEGLLLITRKISKTL